MNDAGQDFLLNLVGLPGMTAAGKKKKQEDLDEEKYQRRLKEKRDYQKKVTDETTAKTRGAYESVLGAYRPKTTMVQQGQKQPWLQDPKSPAFGDAPSMPMGNPMKQPGMFGQMHDAGMSAGQGINLLNDQSPQAPSATGVRDYFRYMMNTGRSDIVPKGMQNSLSVQNKEYENLQEEEARIQEPPDLSSESKILEAFGAGTVDEKYLQKYKTGKDILSPPKPTGDQKGMTFSDKRAMYKGAEDRGQRQVDQYSPPFTQQEFDKYYDTQKMFDPDDGSQLTEESFVEPEQAAQMRDQGFEWQGDSYAKMKPEFNDSLNVWKQYMGDVNAKKGYADTLASQVQGIGGQAQMPPSQNANPLGLDQLNHPPGGPGSPAFNQVNANPLTVESSVPGVQPQGQPPMQGPPEQGAPSPGQAQPQPGVREPGVPADSTAIEQARGNVTAVYETVIESRILALWTAERYDEAIQEAQGYIAELSVAMNAGQFAKDMDITDDDVYRIVEELHQMVEFMQDLLSGEGQQAQPGYAPDEGVMDEAAMGVQ